MFRVSIGSFEDAVGFLEDASSAADNIAYRTDLLLADFRPLAEGSFADASAEAGTGLASRLSCFRSPYSRCWRRCALRALRCLM